ncbi:ORM1-like protein 2 [Gossypium australe]|uniref:ORM1-like protein 2 n=1 Tax=Gossypium australe TaxID=47621 RepID=A0A5B6UL54_9ROSI|nr:ORM1-like protein 2 [Gossypium australe]
MANLYVKAVPPADLNRNTEWFMYPGVWTTYILILFFSWLLVLSIFGCSPGMAWTVVNLAHFLVRFLSLYLIASHTTDYQHPMLFFNTLAVLVLVIAKFPNMHKVRIFGINADK